MNDENIGAAAAENAVENNNSGDNIPADAAQEENFEDLIKGRYREDFQKKVQGIIEARFRKIDAERQRENNSFREEKARAEYNALKDQHTRMLESYPEFDLKSELQNEKFRALISCPDIDIKTAYEVVHLADLLNRAAQSAKEKTALGISGIKSRPGDVIGGVGGTVNSVAALSKKERAELCRRAAAGERLTLK